MTEEERVRLAMVLAAVEELSRNAQAELDRQVQFVRDWNAGVAVEAEARRQAEVEKARAGKDRAGEEPEPWHDVLTGWEEER